MIDNDVKFGKNVRIFNPDLVNIYGCKIGDNTFVGPFVEITRGVIIGKNCNIASHSYICNFVILEDDIFIGHGVMFINNLYPRVGSRKVDKKTIIGKGTSIGTNATIGAGVAIGKYAIIGAGSMVTRNIPAFSIAAGNPARVLKTFGNLKELEEYITKRRKVI